jgi:CPA1 family monovalent cation:H+ antiporter
MHHDGEIHDSVLHSIEEGLDLEEVNARRFL